MAGAGNSAYVYAGVYRKGGKKKIELVRKKIGCLAIQDSTMQYDVTRAYSPRLG